MSNEQCSMSKGTHPRPPSREGRGDALPLSLGEGVGG